MAKNTLKVVPTDVDMPKGKTAIDAPRSTIFRVAPEKLIVVGIDQGGPGDLHYDARVKLPLDEEMVNSIMTFGVFTPIMVEKVGETLVVMFGRQRVRHAREANRRLAEVNQQPVLIPVMIVPRGTSEAEGEAIGLAENTQRRNDDALVLAEKAASYIKRHGETSEAMQLLYSALGLDRVRLDKLLRLRSADAGLLSALKNGIMIDGVAVAVGVEAAIAIASKPKSEQTAALVKLAENAKASGKSRVTATDARRHASNLSARPPVPQVRRALEAATEGGHLDAKALAFIGWMLGDREVDSLPSPIKAAVRKSEKTKREE